MLDFIASQSLFYLALVAVLFMPGYFFTRLINIGFGFFSRLETFVFSIGFSIFLTNTLLLTLGSVHLKITRTSILVSLLLFSAICFALERMIVKKKLAVAPKEFFSFSKKQIFLVCIILGLSIFIRTVYLKNTTIPSATDLGHHMYWTNVIVQKGIVPNYQQRNVLTNSEAYAVSEPQNISDFIVGEHFIFAAIALISGLSVISYFPVLTLFIIDIVSILAIFILTLRLFEKDKEHINIAIASLFLLGPVFAIAPPQAKFVSGGVVGNIVGNLLLPLALYLFLRAMREKSSILLTLALVFSMSLFYTHHLTALIFALSLVLSIAFILIFNVKNSFSIIKDWWKMLLSKPVLSFLFFSLAFALLIYTPTYITNQAIKTVVGAPKKIEHTGLTLTQFKDALGEPRLVLAIIGALLLSYIIVMKMRSTEKNNFYENIPFHVFILAGWIGIITIISLYPGLIGIGIPSGRVANYGTYPFSIVASFCLIFLFFKNNRDEKNNFFIKPTFYFSTFILIFIYLSVSGHYDNGENIGQPTTPQKINQTFNASEFLSKNIVEGDQVESDHVYIKADAWTKIFLMKDYNYPLYRANFERYENGIDRNEKCTLNMISVPNTPDSIKCFNDLNVNYVMVSKKNDASQFQKNQSFWQIYSNDEINIYHRKVN